jgi:NAD-dependent dihydropyrimidine dehydrogenase PreA subunit
MLSDEGDIQDMAGIVAELSRQSGGELVLLMGHGTDHGADKTYAALQSVLDEGNINAVIATVEGSVVLESVLDRIEKTAGRGGTVHLYPLMLVAGDHAKNDMAGEDSESWKSVLSALGYNVVPWLKGMGGNIHFQQMVVRHVRESGRIIFPERYEKMKKGRAARELVRAREDIEWFPVVNADLCTGCGVCLLYCHRDVYAFEKNGSGRDAVIVKNPYNCVVNCSHCRKYCPAGAISFPGKMEGVWREKR